MIHLLFRLFVCCVPFAMGHKMLLSWSNADTLVYLNTENRTSPTNITNDGDLYAVDSTRGIVYKTKRRNIFAMNLDGSGQRKIYTGEESFRFLAVDEVSGDLYHGTETSLVRLSWKDQKATVVSTRTMEKMEIGHNNSVTEIYFLRKGDIYRLDGHGENMVSLGQQSVSTFTISGDKIVALLKKSRKITTYTRDGSISVNQNLTTNVQRIIEQYGFHHLTAEMKHGYLILMVYNLRADIYDAVTGEMSVLYECGKIRCHGRLKDIILIPPAGGNGTAVNGSHLQMWAGLTEHQPEPKPVSTEVEHQPEVEDKKSTEIKKQLEKVLKGLSSLQRKVLSRITDMEPLGFELNHMGLSQRKSDGKMSRKMDDIMAAITPLQKKMDVTISVVVAMATLVLLLIICIIIMYCRSRFATPDPETVEENKPPPDFAAAVSEPNCYGTM